MPVRSLKPCREPGCANLIRDGQFCQDHQRPDQSEYDRMRGSSAKRGYGARWRKLRAMVLQRQPLCADPFGSHAAAGQVVMATDVDHIQPKRRGGRDRMENLQPLCHSCHSRKTGKGD